MNQKQKLNVEVWIEALLSGDYRQGRNVLKHFGTDPSWDSFCCLGVYCVLQGIPATSDGPVSGYFTFTEDSGSTEDFDTDVPDDWFCELTGLTEKNKHDVIVVNDDEAVAEPFPVIAGMLQQWIEDANVQAEA